MFQWARNLLSIGADKSARTITARYDNATTTQENERSRVGVDYLSAKSANSLQVRRPLRNLSRYEIANNPYLFGITNNNADDLISTGPTLKVKTGDEKYDREIEISFAEWAAEVDLTPLLRTIKLAKTVDGEGFAILKSDRSLEHPVKLFPIDIEADQVTTPAPKNLEELWVDGLTLSPVTGRPVAYSVLRHHPGDYFFPSLNPLVVDEVRAEYVIHWFKKFRPGQVRGIPELTSSLDLATDMRAFRKATLGAAEIAADFAAVMTNEFTPANTDAGPDPIKAFQRIAINRKQMVSLPAGSDMKQFDPKQPTTSYEMFQEKCLAETVRPMSYPLNLALGTSQKFNFSSSKLDIVNYRESLTVERRDCERVALDKIFRCWFPEAVLAGAVRKSDWIAPPHEWHWPGFPTLDPLVEAQANAMLISSGQMSWREYFAKGGKELIAELDQREFEKKAIIKRGLSFGDVPQRTVTETTDNPDPASAV